MKTGDKVHAFTAETSAYYLEVFGTVESVRNGWVNITATVVCDRYSKKFKRHPSACGLAAPIDRVTLVESNMTLITVDEMQAFSDSEMLDFLSTNMYRSQYVFPEAFDHAQHRLALMQGARYLATGNPKAFTRVKW